MYIFGNACYFILCTFSQVPAKMKVTELFVAIFAMLEKAETAPISIEMLGRPESNILTRDSRHKFTFTGYPNTVTVGSQPSNVADEESRITVTSWMQYGYVTKQDSVGTAYLAVDLKQKYYVRAFAVSGYAGPHHKPLKRKLVPGGL